LAAEAAPKVPRGFGLLKLASAFEAFEWLEKTFPLLE
jgi:hypothetical protein